MAHDMYQIFREVTERVCGDLEIEKALLNSMQYLRNIMPADFMYMMIIDQKLACIAHCCNGTQSMASQSGHLQVYSHHPKGITVLQ